MSEFLDNLDTLNRIIKDLRADLAAEREMVAELKSWRQVVGDQLLAEIRHSTNLQAERDAARTDLAAAREALEEARLYVSGEAQPWANLTLVLARIDAALKGDASE